jgi:hypothetical protein
MTITLKNITMQNVLKLFTTVIYDVRNRLECLHPVGLSSLVKCVLARLGADPRFEYLKVA